MEREKYIRQIIDALAFLSRKVEISASLNLTDINVHAEDFYRDFLNLALGYNFENINSITQNADAIDLGDITARVAIQVTSTSAIKKTKDTVNKFCAKKLHLQYDRLIVLNLVKVTRHNVALVEVDGLFSLDTREDMWDYNDLAKKIVHKNRDLLKKISDFLLLELDLQSNEELSKEVLTLIAMIDILSDDDHPQAGSGYIESPDPELKVYKRFAEYSEYLTAAYVDLYGMYGSILEVINEEKDIGTIRIRKTALYLKAISDQALTECLGNPRDAIELLVKNFSKILSRRKVEYDQKAIEFFLIDQLIKCNVFPQRKANHA